MSTSRPIAYLPPGIADLIRFDFAGLATEYQWKIARLAEKAFGEGYEAGYGRGHTDGWSHGSADAKADGDDQ